VLLHRLCYRIYSITFCRFTFFTKIETMFSSFCMLKALKLFATRKYMLVMNGYCFSIWYGVVKLVSRYTVLPTVLGSRGCRDPEEDPWPVMLLFQYQGRRSNVVNPNRSVYNSVPSLSLTKTLSTHNYSFTHCYISACNNLSHWEKTSAQTEKTELIGGVGPTRED
jgi:hypothetical protein